MLATTLFGFYAKIKSGCNFTRHFINGHRGAERMSGRWLILQTGIWTIRCPLSILGKAPLWGKSAHDFPQEKHRGQHNYYKRWDTLESHARVYHAIRLCKQEYLVENQQKTSCWNSMMNLKKCFFLSLLRNGFCSCAFDLRRTSWTGSTSKARTCRSEG